MVTFTDAARLPPLFEEFSVKDFFGFFNLCKILDFNINAVTGDHGFAHTINLE